jgi:hypothetical protein
MAEGAVMDIDLLKRHTLEWALYVLMLVELAKVIVGALRR